MFDELMKIFQEKLKELDPIVAAVIFILFVSIIAIAGVSLVSVVGGTLGGILKATLMIFAPIGV